MDNVRSLTEQDMASLGDTLGEAIFDCKEGFLLDDKNRLFIPKEFMLDDPYYLLWHPYSPFAKGETFVYDEDFVVFKGHTGAIESVPLRYILAWSAKSSYQNLKDFHLKGVWVDLRDKMIYYKPAKAYSAGRMPYTAHFSVSSKGKKSIFFKERVTDDKGIMSYKTIKGNVRDFVETLHSLVLGGNYPDKFFNFGPGDVHFLYFKTSLRVKPYTDAKERVMMGSCKDGVMVRLNNSKWYSPVMDMDFSEYAEYKGMFIGGDELLGALRRLGLIWV